MKRFGRIFFLMSLVMFLFTAQVFSDGTTGETNATDTTTEALKQAEEAAKQAKENGDNKDNNKTTTTDASMWGVAETDNSNAAKIMTKIMNIIKPVSVVLIFIAVLMVGFEIIMKRNKADDRMASMSSLLWVGIGALVLGGAGLVASAIMNVLK